MAQPPSYSCLSVRGCQHNDLGPAKGSCFCSFPPQMRGAAGMGVLEKITRDYWRAVQRLRPMRLPFVKQLVILADVEVIYRRERAAKRGALLAQLPTETDIAGNK